MATSAGGGDYVADRLYRGDARREFLDDVDHCVLHGRSTMKLCMALALLLLSATAPRLSAQERIPSPPARPTDTLWSTRASEDSSVLREAPRSRGSLILAGMSKGLLIGGAVGAVSGFFQYDTDQEWQLHSRGEQTVITGLVGAGYGALIGGFIGAIMRRDEPAPNPGRALQVLPAPSGVALSLLLVR